MDLARIPNVAYLHSIAPQTMTVNLVVAVISNPSPKTIHPRRGGPPLQLVEMVVGDETRAGFSINIWLPTGGRDASSELATVVGSLCPGDVILARTVALGSFRGDVFGQSLRRERTRVELVGKGDCGGEDKVGRVREWARNFVGVSVGREEVVKGGMKQKRGQGRLCLPQDTQ
jgi:hypothetical protein